MTALDGNLYGEFEQSFARAGERPAFRSISREVLCSFADLHSSVCRYANALAILGVEPGDRVTVQVDKSLATVFLYLAAMKVGAVYQPLNPAYTLPEVDYFVGDAEPKIIVCDPSRQTAMRELGDRHRVTAVLGLDASGEGSLAALASRMDDRHETVNRTASDLANLLYTSGTTGKSKGAMITHGNLASNAAALMRLWQIDGNDVLLHSLPLFHVHGLHVALNTAFLGACEILWLDHFDVAGVMAALPHATLMMGVPTYYTRLLSESGFGRDICRNMRLFVSGSAPLLAETHRQFRARTGHAILERYGMTETGMIASNPYAGERIAGTVGFALPGVNIRIAGGSIGTIEVKGPNVCKGYWRMPDRTHEDFTREGYFITGDMGSLDEEGRLTIVGRARDVIITGGLNVYPREIEEQIDALAGVVESAVFGVPHSDLGEGVVAAVVTQGEIPSEPELIAVLAQRLAKFKLPKRIHVVGELPRNAMGKVQKSELRRRYAASFRTA
jgi:malonyl-CoA/methylmalonyl-CoA synthetase